MYRAILVPLDGSAFSEQALPVALSIARRAGATVHLAQVHVPRPAPVMNMHDSSGDAADTQARAADRAYLEQVAQRASAGSDRPLSVDLLDGPVAVVLCDYAQTNHIDLIVMSTHGRGALGRMWLGSVAAALVRQAPTPVLLVRPPKMPASPDHEPVFRRILVPLDGSPLAERALKQAVGLGALMQARYTLLQALDPLVVEHTQPPYAAGLDRRLLAEVRASATDYLERIAARLRAQSLHVETKLVVGPPAFAIRDYASEHDIDLIAMATHGQGGLSRLLLGSVTDAVVHAADVPILLYRPSEPVA
jgi:nucleotide-binding universal stress UspA family protein